MTLLRLPRLNRVFEITASEISTSEILIPWRFNAYGAQAEGPSLQPTTSLPSVGKYAWSASLLGSHPFSDVNTSDKLATVTITELELGKNSVNEDDTPNSHLPIPGDVLRDDVLTGKEIRFGPASAYPDSYVAFLAGGRNDYFTTDAKFEDYFFIEVDGDITAVGSAFALDADTDVIVTVEDQIASASVDTPATYRVWGEMKELGLQQTITTSGTLLVTSREQSALLTIRYDSRLLIGETVVDDLDRTWRVVSSRPIRDRRYLEYELALDVV